MSKPSDLLQGTLDLLLLKILALQPMNGRAISLRLKQISGDKRMRPFEDKVTRLCLLEIAYHMLTRKEDYRALGADHFDRIDVNRIRRSLVSRLERLGHKATL